MTRYVPTNAAKEAIRGREAEIVRALGIPWNGSGKHIRCPDPAHPDKNPSWRLLPDGRAVCTCRQPHSIFDVAGYAKGLDFEASKIMVLELIGRDDLIVDPDVNRSHAAGLTLAEYAAAKKLPVDFLHGLGLRDISYNGRAAVEIPYLAPDGRVQATRYRRAMAGDKNKRFRWRKGSVLCLYGADRADRLPAAGYAVLVEGESDTHTLWRHGFPALGLPGAALWNEVRDAPLVAEVPTIFIIVEPDLGGVQTLNWLSKSSIGPRARLIRLPPETKDPSALYLADPAGFQVAFQRALDSAVPAPVSADRPEIDKAAPYQTAKFYIAENFTAADKPTLYYHRGAFYRWSGTAYLETGETTQRAGLYEFLDRCHWRNSEGQLKPVKPDAAMVGNVLDALRAASHLDDATAPPIWLDHFPGFAADEIVACSNGLLHLPTLTLLPHTPSFFTHNSVDFAFDHGAPPPAHWIGFLKQLWPDDQATIDTLQEIFGLALTGDTRHQKAFLMVGPKRSGKGTIARILTRLIGTDNTVAPTLAGLGTNFGLAPLIGKRMAIISDARLGGRADQHAIAERLLSITGEDTISVDRKYRPAWTGRMQVRFLILSNELPRLVDASGALVSRFIVLMLTNSFYGKEDHGLTDRLLTEMSGILNWAIAGWQRLYLRGYLQQPKSAAEAVQDLEDLGSPISAFLRANCVVAPGRTVEISRLYEVWCNWSKEQGRDRPGTAPTFGRDLRAVVPGIKVAQARDEYDQRHRQYEGIGLK